MNSFKLLLVPNFNPPLMTHLFFIIESLLICLSLFIDFEINYINIILYYTLACYGRKDEFDIQILKLMLRRPEIKSFNSSIRFAGVQHAAESKHSLMSVIEWMNPIESSCFQTSVWLSEYILELIQKVGVRGEGGARP